MSFLTDKLETPYKTGIYTNKKIPEINLNDLKYWTYRFLCHKEGEKPKTLESSFRMIERVLFDNQRIFKR